MVGIFGRAIDMKGNFSLPNLRPNLTTSFQPIRAAIAKHGAGSSSSGPYLRGDRSG
jgi:hypothetical protein